MEKFEDNVVKGDFGGPERPETATEAINRAFGLGEVLINRVIDAYSIVKQLENEVNFGTLSRQEADKRTVEETHKMMEVYKSSMDEIFSLDLPIELKAELIKTISESVRKTGEDIKAALWENKK